MQQAKANLAELVRKSVAEGPQEIAHHGQAVAVAVLSDKYARMAGGGESLLAFMQRSPLAAAEDVEFERNPSVGRHVGI